MTQLAHESAFTPMQQIHENQDSCRRRCFNSK